MFISPKIIWTNKLKVEDAEPLDKKDNKVKGTNVFKKPQENWERIGRQI